MRNAKIIKEKQTDKIQVGSVVSVSLNGDEEKIYIVGSGQANPLKGKISYESPLGKAVFGKSVGNEIKIDTGDNKITCKILKIE